MFLKFGGQNKSCQKVQNVFIKQLFEYLNLVSYLYFKEAVWALV